VSSREGGRRMEAAAAAACGGGGGEARGAWARQGGDRERQGGFTPKPTVESGVVSTACAGFPLRAHARREHLGFCVCTHQLV
jgi:hypothetical protein